MPKVDDSLPVSEAIRVDKRALRIRTASLGFRAIAGVFASIDAELLAIGF
jgi:hypothetical protein